MRACVVPCDELARPQGRSRRWPALESAGPVLHRLPSQLRRQPHRLRLRVYRRVRGRIWRRQDVQRCRRAPGVAPSRTPPMRLTFTARGERVVITLLLVVGVVLRLRQYAADRSLWLDEAYLALGIIGPNFAGSVGPLPNGQVAPPGFVLGQRLIVERFGPSEYALRALPVVAAIVALFLFWRLARALLPPV